MGRARSVEKVAQSNSAKPSKRTTARRTRRVTTRTGQNVFVALRGCSSPRRSRSRCLWSTAPSGRRLGGSAGTREREGGLSLGLTRGELNEGSRGFRVSGRAPRPQPLTGWLAAGTKVTDAVRAVPKKHHLPWRTQPPFTRAPIPRHGSKRTLKTQHQVRCIEKVGSK